MSFPGDERSEHIARLSKRRPWFYVLVVSGTIGAAVALTAHWAPGWLIPRLRQHGLEFSADEVMAGAFAVALPLLLAAHRLWRCPACRSFLGYGSFCRGCGLALREGPLRAHLPIDPDARARLSRRRAQDTLLRRLWPIGLALMLLGVLVWAITGQDRFGLIGVVAGAGLSAVLGLARTFVHSSARCPTCQALLGRALHAPRCGGCGRDL